MLESEASEAAAKCLQGEDSPHQLPPPGFRGKAAAIADRGVWDRGDERLILKLRGAATGPTGCRHGGLVRAIATAGEKIELQGEHPSASSEAAPPRPPGLDIKPHLLFERLQVE